MKYVDAFDFAAMAVKTVRAIGKKDFPPGAPRSAALAAANCQSPISATEALVDTLTRLAHDKAKCWVCGDPSNCCVEGACPYRRDTGLVLNSNSQDRRTNL